MTCINQVKLFPRLSIDSVRRVRQLAHTLNGQICAKCGKRSARHMPRIAGPWLAGTFDTDRAVSRAALDSINLVFPTAEKVHGVRKAFQRAILEYCRDAALHETVNTLNDERIVNSDDAEATYARVVVTCLSVLNSLIRELQIDDQVKESHLYEEIFNDAKLWELVHNKDAVIRRSMHRLVQTCLDKRPELIDENVKTVSSAYIYRGLHSDQNGSAVDFVQTLDVLTTALPKLWTHSYSGQKSAVSRLRHFLKQGSQSSSAVFWEHLRNLIRKLPENVLPTSTEEIAGLLSAARTGVSRKDERFNASAAWPTYFTIVDVVISPLQDAEAETVLDTHTMPVVRQYLNATPEAADWTINSAKTAHIVSEIAMIKKVAPLITREWPLFADNIIETAKTSQPEQSKDFDKSQKHLASAGERWADLQRELWNGNLGFAETIKQVFITTSTKILNECVGLLECRNGKPYGAAAIIEQMLRTCAEQLMQQENFRRTYAEFVENKLSSLMFSPSQRHLVHGLYSVRSNISFSTAFSGLVRTILEANESTDAKLMALHVVFPANTPSEASRAASQMPQLQRFLVQSTQTGKTENTIQLFADMVKLEAVSLDTTDAVLSALTGSLITSDDVGSTLQDIDLLLTTNERKVKAFMAHADHGGDQLLPNLLLLEQSPDDKVSEKATTISSKLSSAMSESTSDAKFSLVLRNLDTVSEASLPIDALHELLMKLLGPERKVRNAAEMLPPLKTYFSAICAVMRPPKTSLRLLSPLGGAVHLVQPQTANLSGPIQYDVEGFSQAFRISMYIVKLLTETNLGQQLGDMDPKIMAILHISVLLAEDNVSILGANGLWKAEGGSEGEIVALEFIGQAHSALGEYWKIMSPNTEQDLSTEYSELCSALDELQEGNDTLSPLSYYLALSFTKIHVNLLEIHGYSTQQVSKSEAMLKVSRSAKEPLALVKYISGLRQPLSGTQTLNRFCNELIADLTDLDIGEIEQKGLEKLIFFNTILATQEDAVNGIAKQRLIFLVKHLLPWLDAVIPLSVRVEVCRALVALFPGMHDMYGEHWEQAISFLVAHWTTDATSEDSAGSNEDNILLNNASLKLFATLKRLSRADEPNDDLVDSLKDKEDQIRDCFVELLKAADGISDETHQPLMLTHELLARQLASIPYKALKDVEDLYPLLYTSSRPIQQAAFDLLHKQIPVDQEQRSFDAALENKVAQLPDELLSLILETPTLESLADMSFERAMPLSLQGYLYSWRLLFDHFNGSSYKVKSDHIEQLKDGAYLNGLLGFTFDFLGHSRGQPIDASGFDVQDYTPDVEPSPEKDVQWLLTHLYFLALSHLPSLAKSYYLDIRSRQTSLAVEKWTAKHISPHIINASLKAVAEWSEKSVKEDPEYGKMAIKVGMRSKEINVSYMVDEQTMAIKVVLPDAYPLASAQVVGVSRVAVKEEKWQSWLRNCQGVITFSVSPNVG